MGTIKRLVWVICLVSLMILPCAFAEEQEEQRENEEEGEALLVGHISHIEGELVRYVPEDEDWVVTVEDTPVGKDDMFSSDKEVKAEFIMPNNTWIRIGGDTEIQILKLEDTATEVDLDSGVGRFYNKSSATVMSVITPFGNVAGPPQTAFDVYVHDESAEVVALQGQVDFVPLTDTTTYEVIAGSSSLIAGHEKITSGEGEADDDWHSWNLERDALWEKRSETQGDSSKYLPDNLRYESHALDENGVWENIYYEGDYHRFWRPTYISSGWAPFSVGRWTMWYGDHCWVPYEPFGYITHHYGNWIYIDNRHCWYWAPPLWHMGMRCGPHHHTGCGWYPGRVRWIHRGDCIGWIPLAPDEWYYGHHHWGPRSHVVTHTRRIDIRNHRFRDHAVIVNRKHFYDTDDYSRIRLHPKGVPSFTAGYEGASVINGRVIKGFKEMKNRFNFKNSEARRKPSSPGIERAGGIKPDANRFLREKGLNLKPRAIKTVSEINTTHTPVDKKLGITNTVVPVRKTEHPRVIKNREGLRSMPDSMIKRTRPGITSGKSVLTKKPAPPAERFILTTPVQGSAMRETPTVNARSLRVGSATERPRMERAPMTGGHSFKVRSHLQRSTAGVRGATRR